MVATPAHVKARELKAHEALPETVREPEAENAREDRAPSKLPVTSFPTEPDAEKARDDKASVQDPATTTVPAMSQDKDDKTAEQEPVTVI